MLFGPFEARYLHQKRLCKNHSFGTATIHHGLKVVLNRECAEHENEAVKCSANSLLRTTFRPWKLAAVPKL